MRSFILKSILAVLTVIAVASCSTSSKLNAVKTLTSAPWELSTINGQTADVNQFRTGIPFLLFEKGGLLKGSTGCNNFNGKFDLSKTDLSLDAGAMTRMACQGNGEQTFLTALKNVKKMKVEGDKLILTDGLTELMTLKQKK